MKALSGRQTLHNVQVTRAVEGARCVPSRAILRDLFQPRLRREVGGLSARGAGQQPVPQRGGVRLRLHPLWRRRTQVRGRPICPHGGHRRPSPAATVRARAFLSLTALLAASESDSSLGAVLFKALVIPSARQHLASTLTDHKAMRTEQPPW